MKNKKNIIQKFFLGLIGFYQKYVSPGMDSHCRFYPSCSSYTVLAIEKYGAFKGLIKGLWRILKCNPYNKGGINLP